MRKTEELPVFRMPMEGVKEVVAWLNQLLEYDRRGVDHLLNRSARVKPQLANTGLIDTDAWINGQGNAESRISIVHVLNGAFGYKTGELGSIVFVMNKDTNEILNFAQVTPDGYKK